MRAITQSGLLLLLSLAGVLAAPQKPGCHKVKETVHVPHGWVQHSDPHPDHKIVLKVGLPQPNFDILEKHLYEVSDPTHPRYGDHLTKEQVEELVAPHKESVDLVDEWLQAHGIDINTLSRSPAKDWVTVTVPVSLAEKMLDTKYYVYKHTSSGDSIVRTTSYSLPEELHEHVDVIQPTTMFGQFKALKTTFVFDSETPAAPGLAALSKTVSTPVDPSCNTTITIKCLQQLYNTVGFTPSAKGNSIGITGYLEQFANLQDLETFYEEQRPDAAGTSFKFVSVNGGLNNQTLEEAGAEANLDVQFAYGLSYPIPGTFWSTGGRPPFTPDIGTPTNTNEPYAEWLDYILKQKDIPHAISTSYGDHEQTVPKSYALRTCAQFAQLGARGVSLTFSSGDGGVGDNESDPAQQTCFTNDGKNNTRFIPLFPASCPFVTAIGGTQNINPEVAVSRFGSGGGFSDYFPRPAYQEVAVSGFLKKLGKDTYKGLFNRNGRGIPDVAAQGDRYRIWLAGVPRSIGGTSASSPTFAGIVALLNDARLSAGKKPLGWLNPLIYSAAANDFTDITSGKNPGCGTEGFNATVGWDPVTGLGTPDFQKLKTTVLKHWF